MRAIENKNTPHSQVLESGATAVLPATLHIPTSPLCSCSVLEGTCGNSHRSLLQRSGGKGRWYKKRH
eukprot:1147173-Pelagomonas_calceolata.AAC.3